MDDHTAMGLALDEARTAEIMGEVPVGALALDSEHNVLAKAYNQPITNNDPTAHAEIVALRASGAALQNYRLSDITVVVTLEPCPMCLSAMIHARIRRLVFGAFDPKSGAVTSVCDWIDHPVFHHRLTYIGGIREQECGGLLQRFFQKRR